MKAVDEMKLRGDYRFKSTPLNGFTKKSFSFSHAIKPTTARAALEWFGGEAVSAANYVKHLQKNFNIPAWADEARVSSTLMGTEKIFKDSARISWPESQFGANFEKSLEDLGARVFRLSSPNQPALEVLVALHRLSDGTWFLMIGEAWRENKGGAEFIYWHFDALDHTRHFHLKPHPSTQFFIPHFLQSAAFLSESSDPDSLEVSIPRDAMFGVSGDFRAPQIAIHQERDHHHASIYFNEKGNSDFFFSWSPETIRYGYIFREVEDISTLEIAIAVATSALPKVAEILVDGYSNYQVSGNHNFQEITFADDHIYKDGALDHFSRGRFIAGPIAEFMDFEAFRLYSKIEDLQEEAVEKRDADSLRVALNGYQEIISKGSGVAVAYALNHYVYAMQNYAGVVLGLSSDERAEFHDYGAKLLKYSTTLSVDLEDANAYSGLALLEISRGKFNDALTAVNAGITLLKEDRSHIPQSLLGDSNPQTNPHIKLELFATRAELLYRAGEITKAKDIAAKVLAEAESQDYEGPEIKKVKWILEH